MALTPYIWLLWQTKSGKVIIYLCGLVVLCVFIYALIEKYGWWCLPFGIFIAIASYFSIKQAKKEQDEELRRLSEETDRLHKMADSIEGHRRKREKRLLKELNNNV